MTESVKLNQIQAAELVKQAWLDVEKYGMGSYRFGQSLWNRIPMRILSQYVDIGEVSGYPCGYKTEVDFFYIRDSDVVMEKFYKYFVE